LFVSPPLGNPERRFFIVAIRLQMHIGCGKQL
jgi:hypothetical protein